MAFQFSSKIFHVEKIFLSGTDEYILPGGRHLFEKLPQAFDGIQQIGVIGWGSQGPAQAQNLRDSLEGSKIKVSVGLREHSASRKDAAKAGFREENGTLGEMFDVISTSDLVILLISDAAQANLYPKIFAAMKKGATLGLSHGFLLGHIKNQGDHWPAHINVIGVCPKGMGPSVRRLYEQGKTTSGAGINTSFSVEQDINGKATDYALSWSIALGAPFTFMTSLEMEYRSDIFGERGILLGAVHGIVEYLYRFFLRSGHNAHAAFNESVESITGPISRTISKHGILAVYTSMSDAHKRIFEETYVKSYLPAKEILTEIYQEVRCGNEIRSIILAGERMKHFPMGDIETTEMWQIGKEVRASRDEQSIPLNPTSAGIYIATMMAQIDVLYEADHSYSEIVNESVIEAVDSLNPYMHYKGVSYMVDNCSTTARLGARKWAPRFDYIFSQQLSGTPQHKNMSIEDFLQHKVHESVSTLLKYRPSIDISVK